jgi:hypothetical protein
LIGLPRKAITFSTASECDRFLTGIDWATPKGDRFLTEQLVTGIDWATPKGDRFFD